MVLLVKILPGMRKAFEKIKKVEQLKKYEQAVEEILETCSLIHTGDRYD